jgi:hypothetical protein
MKMYEKTLKILVLANYFTWDKPQRAFQGFEFTNNFDFFWRKENIFFNLIRVLTEGTFTNIF